MEKKDSGNDKLPKVKGISFKPYYQREYDFLETQDNKSRFVCELIKEYLDKKEREEK